MPKYAAQERRHISERTGLPRLDSLTYLESIIVEFLKEQYSHEISWGLFKRVHELAAIYGDHEAEVREIFAECTVKIATLFINGFCLSSAHGLVVKDLTVKDHVSEQITHLLGDELVGRISAGSLLDATNIALVNNSKQKKVHRGAKLYVIRPGSDACIKAVKNPIDLDDKSRRTRRDYYFVLENETECVDIRFLLKELCETIKKILKEREVDVVANVPGELKTIDIFLLDAILLDLAERNFPMQNLSR